MTKTAPAKHTTKKREPIRSFVVCNVPGSPSALRTLAVTAQAQAKLEQVCKEQEKLFLGDDIVRVDFDPTYKTDEESVQCIEGFALPEHIREPLSNPDEVPLFSTNDSVPTVKSAIHVGPSGIIYFQCWRHVEVFSRQKIWLLMSGATFDLEENTPLILDRHIDAVYSNGSLLFKNLANTSSMLDLFDYVSEATAEDMKAFVGNPLFTGSLPAIKAKSSRVHLRQIRLLIQANILKGHTIESLADRAKANHYVLPMKGGKILIPSGGLALSDFLSFLNDKIYLGPITGKPMTATSARPRNPR